MCLLVSTGNWSPSIFGLLKPLNPNRIHPKMFVMVFVVETIRISVMVCIVVCLLIHLGMQLLCLSPSETSDTAREESAEVDTDTLGV